MKKILLIITGSIAAYKSLDLIRSLRRAGHDVIPVLTKHAEEFVTPLSVASLAQHQVYRDLFSLTDEATMGHITLARSCDEVLVAPATANIISKYAHGLCDDLASTLLLVTNKPVTLVPAMNVSMWHHEATQANIQTLLQRGARIIQPAAGSLACGETGEGRMAEIETILEALLPSSLFAGKHVLITAGPTQEPLDPIRYLSNHSSGKQGYALAEAFAQLGANVTLVSGPTALAAPLGVSLISVTTAQQMLDACLSALPAAIAICTAAVADWRVEAISAHKQKKAAASTTTLNLIKTPDILATLSRHATLRPALVIGFAAETQQADVYGQEKCHTKGCDIILANEITPERPIFEQDQTQLMWITPSEQEAWPLMSKKEAAHQIAIKVATLL